MSDPVTIIQITDSHIFDEPEGELSGVNTRQSLQCVLDMILSDFADADLLVLTGDNTHESTEQAYLVLKQMLEKMPMPYTFLPGNHDHNEPMAALIGAEQENIDGFDDGEDASIDKWLSVGNWNILLLDSHVEDQVAGLLARDEIEFTKQMLSYTDGSTLIFLHHPLKPVGCAWLDKQLVANADELFDVVGKFNSVKLIVNGHVHQQWEGEHGNIKLYSTPSTCMQFKPNSDDYAEDDAVPGFRWIKLFDNDTFETGVVRVPLS